MFKDSGRKKIVDQKLDSDLSSAKLVNVLFERLVAKNLSFKEVDFRYCIFDVAYLRKCKFEDCDFTGCRFSSSNLLGCSFSGCKFDYAIFEKTMIDSDVLDYCCPGPENLKLKFARSLRLNYQQLGDAKAANKAINIELQATEDHLKKAWNSKESYYRKKYSGFSRVKMFGEWIGFKVLDVIWGNGESTWKLLRAVLAMMVIIALNHVYVSGNVDSLDSYLNSFLMSPQLLLGVTKPEIYSSSVLAAIFLVRLILFGFFMSIIIKRFNRR